MKTLIALLTVGAFLVCALSATPTAARTWHILPDGTGDAPTIQAGIDSAAVGDVVEVACGTYLEHLQMKSGITLRSETGQADCVIVTADHGYACWLPLLSCVDVNITSSIQGIRFADHFSAGAGRGMRCLNSNLTIENCSIVNMQPDYADFGGCGGGLYSDNSSLTFIGCVFMENFAPYLGGGGGIYASDSYITLIDCKITDNSTDWIGGGIVATNSDISLLDSVSANNSSSGAPAGLFVNGGSLTVQNCTFSGNNSTYTPGSESGNIAILSAAAELNNTIISFGNGRGLFCWQAEVMLACCNIFGNEGGDWVGDYADQIDVRGNFSAPPCFCDAENGDFHLCADSYCLPENHPWGWNQLVGAYGQDCAACDCPSQGPVPTVVTTWGGVKAMYK